MSEPNWEKWVAIATIALAVATLALAVVALLPIVADLRRRRREGQSFRRLVRIAALDHIRRLSAHADGSTSGTQRNAHLVRDAARELKMFVPDSHVLSEAEADALSVAAETLAEFATHDDLSGVTLTNLLIPLSLLSIALGKAGEKEDSA